MSWALWMPRFHDEKPRLRVHGTSVGPASQAHNQEPYRKPACKGGWFPAPLSLSWRSSECVFDSVYSKWSWKGDQDHGVCAPAEQRWRICGPQVRPRVLAARPRAAAEFLCGHKFSTSLVTQMLRSLPTMQETHVWSRLGRSPGEGNGSPL